MVVNFPKPLKHDTFELPLNIGCITIMLIKHISELTLHPP